MIVEVNNLIQTQRELNSAFVYHLVKDENLIETDSFCYQYITRHISDYIFFISEHYESLSLLQSVEILFIN